MDVLSTLTTKGQTGWEAARTAIQNQDFARFIGKSGGKNSSPFANLSVNISNPFAKSDDRPRLEQLGARLTELGEAIFEIGEAVGMVVAMYGPLAARQLGWAEVPKQKRTAPRVAAGAVIGAGAVYFLEPKCGPGRREQVLRLMGNAPAQPGDAPAQPVDAPAQPDAAPAQPDAAPAEPDSAPAPTS
jgi:hypothetical protein